MAQSSFPFENVDTTETQFSQMFRTLNAGVNGTPAGTELKVSAGTGLQVSVALGQAMVRGHYYISTAAELLTISTANATNPRIDTVVLRLDPVANSIVLAVVAGTAAASPVAPTLTQTDAGTYEFPLANVAVAAGAGTVGTITDRRVFMGKRLQSVGTSAARDIVFPSPVQGDMVWRDDLGVIETYYGLYNSTTNPGGRDSAGWYSDIRSGGLIPVRPTSVTIASGSGSANALGVISFTGASAVTINGVFTSAYKNYRLLINIDNASGQTSLGQQLTSSGTAASGALYFWAGNWQTINGSGPSILAASNQTFWYMIEATNGGVTWVNHAQDIYNPALAKDTSMSGSGITISSNWRHVSYSCMHQNATAYDGIKFTSSTAATFTGTIQILGYND